MIKDIDKKTKVELIKDFAEIKEHNTLQCEQYSAAITTKSAEDIEKSIYKFNNTVDVLSKKSDEITKKVFWLNVVLAFATLVGAVATSMMAYKMFCK